MALLITAGVVASAAGFAYVTHSFIFSTLTTTSISSIPTSTTISTTTTISITSVTTTSIIYSDCGSPTDANYILQYNTAYWSIYAYNSTWNTYKNYYLEQINYPDQVYSQLARMFNVDPVNSVSPHKLYLAIWQQTGGGFATGCIGEIGKGPAIGISYDAWVNPYAGADNWSVELIAHETVNLFTGFVIGGWPVDWWADEISPFPYSNKILVEEALNHTSAAQASINSEDPLTGMFLNISSEYGTGMYARMFSDIKNDGWTVWFGPNPSQLLSEYAVAYLSIAANTSLVSTVNNGYTQNNAYVNSGHAGHIVNYTINSTVVNAIIAERNALQSQVRDSSCWQLFRGGTYNAMGC